MSYVASSTTRSSGSELEAEHEADVQRENGTCAKPPKPRPAAGDVRQLRGMADRRTRRARGRPRRGPCAEISDGEIAGTGTIAAGAGLRLPGSYPDEEPEQNPIRSLTTLARRSTTRAACPSTATSCPRTTSEASHERLRHHGPRAAPLDSHHDPHVRAAVELLIEHEIWIRRADFRRACIDAARREAWIDWRKAREFVDSGSRGLDIGDGHARPGRGARGEPLQVLDHGPGQLPDDRAAVGRSARGGPVKLQPARHRGGVPRDRRAAGKRATDPVGQRAVPGPPGAACSSGSTSRRSREGT